MAEYITRAFDWLIRVRYCSATTGSICAATWRNLGSVRGTPRRAARVLGVDLE
jgi:hypothetical protein